MKFAIWLCLTLSLTISSIASAATYNSATVTWTTPGDDGIIGTATQFDLRYSTSPITAANFASATRFMATPTPAAPGTVQSCTVTGLNANQTYYFAIKTGDESNNWAAISNVTSITTLPAPDVTRPAMIALSVSGVTDSTITLNWVATGDDSLTGTGTSYDIRVNTGGPVTAATWNSATQLTVGIPTPAVAGTAQSYVARGLNRQQTYYFAIRMVDEVGNISAISNSPSATTTDTMAPGVVTTLTAS